MLISDLENQTQRKLRRPTSSDVSGLQSMYSQSVLIKPAIYKKLYPAELINLITQYEETNTVIFENIEDETGGV